MSDDSLAEPSVSNAFRALSNSIDCLPTTPEGFVERCNATMSTLPLAQSTSELWCGSLGEAYNLSMDHANPKALEKALQKLILTPRSGKSPHSQMLRVEELVAELVDSAPCPLITCHP